MSWWHWWHTIKAWNRGRIKRKSYRRELKKGRCPCRFARTEDGLCPSYVTVGPYVIHRHNIGRCCKMRMEKAKMDFALIHDNITNCTCTPQVRQQCIEGLKAYKENYPEEYAHVFGENEEIGYRGKFTGD